MARNTPRPVPTEMQTLKPLLRYCPTCGETLWAAYHNYRTITTLDAVLGLTLQSRRCLNQACPHLHQPHRPEQEGRLALPKHEFGLDVIAFVGQQRYGHHRSVSDIHQALLERRVAVAPRTVTKLLERYDELVALSLQDTTRLQRITQVRGRIILALDGLQPDVGHEVLWVVRDCHSGEILLARSLLSATVEDLKGLLTEVRQALPVPIRGVIYDADRHTKKELKKRVRGVRPIERQAEKEQSKEAEVVRDYCAAVRAAVTDDGRPPLAASGLKLHERLTKTAASLDRVVTKAGRLPRGLEKLRRLLRRGLEQ